MQHRVLSIAAVLILFVVWSTAAPLQAQSGQQLEADGTFDLRLVSTGDITILVAQDSRSGVAVFRCVDGEPFQRVEFVPSDDPLARRVDGLWATTHGFFIFQRAGRSARARLSRSVDGARWDTITSSAFDMPANVNDLVQFANGDLLAVGALRASRQTAMGSTEATLWRSPDGDAWERVSIDAVGLDGVTSFGSIATLGTRVVVSGQRNGSFLWRSDDSGASWSLIGPAGELPMVAAVAGRFLSFELPPPLQAPEFTFATSNDGEVWQQSRAAALIDEGLSLFPHGAESAVRCIPHRRNPVQPPATARLVLRESG